MLVRRSKTKVIVEWMLERPARVIVASFLLIMAVGTLLLMLPFVTNSGESIGFFDSLFTTVSATCVTGLVVRDTATTFNTLGRCILLVLIQVGGLGLVTIYSFAVTIFRRRVTVRTRVLAQENTGSFSFSELKGLLKTIFLMTFGFEFIGFIMFSTRLFRNTDMQAVCLKACFHQFPLSVMPDLTYSAIRLPDRIAVLPRIMAMWS